MSPPVGGDVTPPLQKIDDPERVPLLYGIETYFRGI